MILDIEPTTVLEAQLQEALCTRNTTMEAQKEVMAEMQAQTVLQSMYLEGVRGQLQTQQGTKSKRRKTSQIKMDGRCKVLTQADIIGGVKEWEDDQEKAVEEATVRKKAKEKYAAAMDIWKVRKMDRKERNALLKDGWDKDVKKWAVEQGNAKYDRCKPRWTKPKMPTMEKAFRKPMVADFNTEDSGSEEENEEDEDNDNDGDVQMADGDSDSN
jgi:hypothetical protein